MAGVGDTIGARIRYYRTANNLTQARLAEVTGVSDGQISRWENGKEFPNQTNIASLASAFGIHVRVLTVGDEGTQVLPADTPEVRNDSVVRDIWNYPLLGEKFFGSRIKNSGLKAIGETVLLVDAWRREFRTIKIRSVMEPREALSREPSGAELKRYIRSCADYYSEAVVEYLSGRADLRNSAAGVAFENEKLGIQALTLPTQPGQVFEISAVRTSFWTEREFNRRIVLHDVDAGLIGLADNAWERLLKHHVTQIVFDFPCTIYVELAVVTSDNQFLVLRKARNVPNIPVWCCSVERGFRWGRDVKPGEFDVKPVLVECLEAELQLTSGEIAEWSLFGLGIKAHLDSAILGYVKLKLTAKQLSAVIGAGIKNGRIDYFSEFRLVALDNLEQVLKTELWNQLHPTSLARFELTLRSLLP